MLRRRLMEADRERQQGSVASMERITELEKCVFWRFYMYKRMRIDTNWNTPHSSTPPQRLHATTIRQILEGEAQRRKMHNLIQELRGNVRVYARVRPYLPADGQEEQVGGWVQ